MTSWNTLASTRSPGRNSALARLRHGDPLGHLPDDQLDVLVVDRHALVAVDALHLGDEVLLGLADALDVEELLGVLRGLGVADEHVAGGHLGRRRRPRAGPPAARRSSPRRRRRTTTLTVRPLPSSSSMRTTPEVRARIALPFGLRASNSSTTRGRPPAMSPRRGDAAGVEGPHGELRAGLADGLGGDDADRLAELDGVAGGQRAAVAGAQTPRSAWQVSGAAHPDPRDGLVVADARPSAPRRPSCRRRRPCRRRAVTSSRSDPAEEPGLEVGRACRRCRARCPRARGRGRAGPRGRSRPR